ncbi:MAG TPA: M20/M25/M40 family metallo-hydrolase [Gemmatimonadaceae bacterium]|nr:M20/M25/M40 family metallo-hydrolase [Gemmatimonadaceae bacterium]
MSPIRLGVCPHTMVGAAMAAWFAAALIPSADAAAQRPAPGAASGSVQAAVAAARRHREGSETAIVRELAGLLAIPNVAADSVNIRRNAEHLVAMLRRRGAEARILDNDGHPPAVFGELRAPGATRTIVMYAHYDGQPVDSSQWASPPWTPTLRTGVLGLPGVREMPIPERGRLDGEWRIYARSASDDKSPIVAMLAAIDGLRAAGIPLGVNVKFFLEGEEEAGSPNLQAMLERHRALLGADLWLFCDGPVHQTRRPQVVFGVRGSLGLEMAVYGPTRGLHSGHYGNWAPNPAALLAQLVASMRDDDGRITIANYGDDVRPITAAERAALATVPDVDAQLRRDFGLARTEAENAPLGERIMLPAINVRGLEAGHVGALAANAIPTIARASIDFRLVPDQTPARVRSLVEAHLRGRGWHIVRDEPDSATRLAHPRIVRLRWGLGYPATRTAIDLPASQALLRVVEEATGERTIAVPTLGGSLPMHAFGEVLGVPLIVLPMVNHDNNQHAANENLRLRNLWQGIELYAAVLAGMQW